MSWFRRVREWLVGRPFAVDVLVAAFAVLLGLAPTLVGPDRSEFGLEFNAWSAPLVVLASGALVYRRSRPQTVWIVTVALGLAVMMIDGEPSPAYLPAIIALYTLACLSAFRVTVVAAIVTALVPFVVALVRTESDVTDTFAGGLTAWCLLAAASGVAVRSKRAAVAEAHERARQAEATREEEAQRRVAEERLRIARELHDVVAHHVSVINVQAGVAGHLLRTDPDKAAEALAHVREASQIVLREVPGLLGLLRSDDALERAPAPGLGEVAHLIEAARRSGLDVTWRTTGHPTALSPGADLAAFRVLQEALTNAARHGSGGAMVTFTYDDVGFSLEVRNQRDRGVAPPHTERHGLVGMRERVASVGGELTVGPDGDRDWIVRMHLPSERAAVVEAT